MFVLLLDGVSMISDGSFGKSPDRSMTLRFGDAAFSFAALQQGTRKYW